ncbi:MAG TPA: protease inhibitor I42 family protein [Syntrophorhabdaceae bacterium]|jgi:predicted secreted protein
MAINKWNPLRVCFLYGPVLLLSFPLYFMDWVQAAPEDDTILQGNPLIVTMADNGKEICLKTGEIFRIELSTYGTAGYSWQFEQMDKEYLEIVDKESKAASGLMGAPTKMAWQLKALRAGNTKIEMYNYRIWEGREKAVSRFSLGIDIK